MGIIFLSAMEIILTQDHTNITNDTEKVKTNTRWASSRVDGHSPIGVMDGNLSGSTEMSIVNIWLHLKRWKWVCIF